MIAFVRTGEQGRDIGDIYVVNPDGSGERNLTQTPGLSDDTNPVWSPDGGKIAFVSQRPNSRGVWSFNIFVVGAQGGPIRRLTNSLWSDSPVWSPDGKRIAFIRRFRYPPGNQVGDTTPEIFVMNADGSRERRLTRNTLQESAPDWSRTGKLAFVRVPRRQRDTEIFTMNRDGIGLRQLTQNRLDEDALTWSPDGRRLAYVQSTPPNAQRSSVWIMNPDGSGQRRLTPRTSEYAPYAVWSPDGTRLALTWGVPGDTYIVNANGRGLRRVIRGGSPTWSPDGRMIAFGRHPAIYVANADGSGERRLVPEPGAPLRRDRENWSPVWSGRP